MNYGSLITMHRSPKKMCLNIHLTYMIHRTILFLVVAQFKIVAAVTTTIFLKPVPTEEYI